MPIRKITEETPEPEIEKKDSLPDKFGEVTKAATRGIVTGTLGLPGEAEYFASYTVPRALGFEAPEAKIPYRGATFFPRIEEVEKTLEPVMGKTPEGYKPIQTLAEFIGGPAAEFKVGGAVEDLVRALKPSSAIARRVGEATTVSDVGEKMQNKLLQELESLKTGRKAEASKDFAAYLSEGAQKETQILEGYKKSLRDLYASEGRQLSPQERKLLTDSIDRLSDVETRLSEKVTVGPKLPVIKMPPGIQALEKERRTLQHIAEGFTPEGQKAIPNSFATKLQDLLEKNIFDNVKNAEKAISHYKELSGPINQYKSALGQKVTAEVGDFLPSVTKTDPANIPKAVFNTRRSLSDFKKMANDDKFVNEVAAEHVANDLVGLRKSEQIDKYINDNRDWLPEVDKVQKKLEKLSSDLRKAETAKGIAKGAAALAGFSALYNASSLKNYLLGQ